MNFNHEELMLMMLYNTGIRLGLIHELRPVSYTHLQHRRHPRHDGGDAAGVLPWNVRKERSALGKAAVVLCAVDVYKRQK